MARDHPHFRSAPQGQGSLKFQMQRISPPQSGIPSPPLSLNPIPAPHVGYVSRGRGTALLVCKLSEPQGWMWGTEHSANTIWHKYPDHPRRSGQKKKTNTQMSAQTNRTEKRRTTPKPSRRRSIRRRLPSPPPSRPRRSRPVASIPETTTLPQRDRHRHHHAPCEDGHAPRRDRDRRDDSDGGGGRRARGQSGSRMARSAKKKRTSAAPVCEQLVFSARGDQ